MAIPVLLCFEIESFETRLLVCCLTALLLATNIRLNNKEIITRTMIWLGDRSYSVYLVHLPIMHFLKANLSFHQHSSILFFTSGIIASIGLGGIQYSWIERRFRHKSLTRLHLYRVGLTLSFSSATLITISSLVQNNKVIAERVFVSKEIHLVRAQNCIDTTKTFDSCQWIAPNEKGKILLVGDSQAMAFGDGLIAAASELNLSTIVASRSGCPFGKIETDGNRELPCNSWQREVLNYALASKPELVIIANWSIGYTNPQLGWRKLIMANGQLANTRSEAVQTNESGISKYLRALSRAQIRVLIVGDGPYLPNLDTRTLASLFASRKILIRVC